MAEEIAIRYLYIALVFRAALLPLVLLVSLNGCALVREIATTPQFQNAYHTSVGVRYFRQRRYIAALSEFNMALQAEPDDAYSLQYRAGTYMILRNYKSAVIDLKHAERVLPATATTQQRSWTISMRAQAEADAGYSAAAESDYARLARYEPKSPWVRDNIASLLFAEGKVTDAIAAEDHAITLAPANAWFYNDRCFYRAATIELEGALADCDIAMKYRPPTGLRLHVLSSRALVYVKLLQPTKAIADCNAAFQIAPTDPDSLYLRGFAERQMGDANDARRDISAALAEKPSMTREYKIFGLK